MALNVKAIEVGRETRRGRISEADDLEWEAYLQAHNKAETLGLLAHDSILHAHLDEKLAIFEEKYGVGKPTT